MRSNFSDIRERIIEEPSWYDSNGTPRYGKFDPELCPDIYAHTVTLTEIACQACGRRFKVEMHTDVFGNGWHSQNPKEFHYGDPPIHNCVGDSMNCEDLEVLEVWKTDYRNKNGWKRCRNLEGKID